MKYFVLVIHTLCRDSFVIVQGAARDWRGEGGYPHQLQLGAREGDLQGENGQSAFGTREVDSKGASG